MEAFAWSFHARRDARSNRSASDALDLKGSRHFELGMTRWIARTLEAFVMSAIVVLPVFLGTWAGAQAPGPQRPDPREERARAGGGEGEGARMSREGMGHGRGDESVGKIWIAANILCFSPGPWASDIKPASPGDKDPRLWLMARNFRELNHHLWELRDSISIVADWIQRTEMERQDRLARQARERPAE
jgi:hypothetical protein